VGNKKTDADQTNKAPDKKTSKGAKPEPDNKKIAPASAKEANNKSNHEQQKKKIEVKKPARSKRRRGENEELIQGRESLDNILAILFLTVLFLLPLLIRVHTGMFVAPRFVADVVNTAVQGEVFTYFKTGLLYTVTILVIIVMVVKAALYKWRIEASYINLPLLVLAFTILLSGVAAEAKGLAMFGMYNRHEGTLTYLCYLTLFFAAATTQFKSWFPRLAISGIGIVTAINTVIILFHFFNHDLYQLAWVKSMIVPASMKGVSASGTLWSTFNNPNYVSGIGAALAIFFFTLSLKAESIKTRLAMGVLAISAYALMAAAISTSGWIALMIALPFAIILGFRGSDLRIAGASAVIILVGCALVLVGMNNYNPKVAEEPRSFLASTVGQAWQEVFEDEQVQTPAPTVPSPGKTETKPAAEKTVTDDFNLPKAGITAGSGRLYIWQKTIELIKERPILGYGLDTIPYYFPQNDIMKVAGLGTYNQVVDKPHCFYLQLAYGCGLIALLALLGLFVLFLYNGLRFAWQAVSDEKGAFIAAIVVFFVAFALQWLFNDSIIGTSPMFWVLTGVGVALGRET